MTVSSRGTSNGNERGNNEDRRKRKAWLMETYESDRWILLIINQDGEIFLKRTLGDPDLAVSAHEKLNWVAEVKMVPTVRCYRCGDILSITEVTIDRIVPGCLGGTYAHNNIRPACSGCNSETGARMANSKTHRAAKMKARILKRKCDHCGASRGQRCWGQNGKNLSTFHAPRRASA